MEQMKSIFGNLAFLMLFINSVMLIVAGSVIEDLQEEIAILKVVQCPHTNHELPNE